MANQPPKTRPLNRPEPPIGGGGLLKPNGNQDPFSGYSSTKKTGGPQGPNQSAYVQMPSVYRTLSDLDQPTDLTELFKACRYLATWSPVHKAFVTAMSTIPITDIVLKNPQKSSQALEHAVETSRSVEVGTEDPQTHKLSEILQRHWRLKKTNQEVARTYYTYSNAVVLLSYPFTKTLTCRECGHQASAADSRDWVLEDKGVFRWECPECGHRGHADAHDKFLEIPEDVRLVVLDTERVVTTYNEFRKDLDVYYEITKDDIDRIKERRPVDRDFICSMPQAYIEAAMGKAPIWRDKNKVMVKLRRDHCFVMKSSTLTRDTRGLAFPEMAATLKDYWMLQLLQKAQEAIATGYVVPMRVIYPEASRTSGNLFEMINVSSYMNVLRGEVEKHKRDPDYTMMSPFPVGSQVIGGEAKQLMLHQEIRILMETIAAGLGCPLEFIFGGLCLVGDSLIPTSRGLLRLDELTDGAPLRALDLRVPDHEGGYSKAVSAHMHGEKPLWKLRTASKFTLGGADTHPVQVLQEDLSVVWKNLADVKQGDRVAISVGADLWPEQAPCVSEITEGAVSSVTPELMRILGYLTAEGSVGGADRHWAFSNKDFEILEDFVNCVESVFGYRPNISDSSSGSDCKVVYVTRKEVISALKALGVGGYSDEKDLPWLVRRSPRHLVAEYLSAYYEGDGCACITNNKRSVVANSKSENLLQSTRALLLNMGIPASLYPPYENRSVLTLSITSEYTGRFRDLVGFISDRKNSVLNEPIHQEAFRTSARRIPFLSERLQELRERRQSGNGWSRKEIILPSDWPETCSVAELAEFLERSTHAVYWYLKTGRLHAEKTTKGYLIRRDELERFLAELGPCSREPGALPYHYWGVGYDDIDAGFISKIRDHDPELADRVQYLVDTEFWWDEVTSVEDTGEMALMYDLSVEGTHSYVANGVVVHNSYSGSNVSIKQQEAKFDDFRNDLLEMNQWAMDHVCTMMNLPKMIVEHKAFRMGDDLQYLQMLTSLLSTQLISQNRVHEELGIDTQAERHRIEADIEFQNKLNELRANTELSAQERAMVRQAIGQAAGQVAGTEEMVSRRAETAERIRNDQRLYRLVMADPQLAMMIFGANSDEVRMINNGYPATPDPEEKAPGGKEQGETTMAPEMLQSLIKHRVWQEQQGQKDPADLARRFRNLPRERWSVELEKIQKIHGQEAAMNVQRYLMQALATADVQPEVLPARRPA